MIGWLHIPAVHIGVRTSNKKLPLSKRSSEQYLKLLLVLACVRITRLTRDMRLAVQLLTVHLLPPVTIQIM